MLATKSELLWRLEMRLQSRNRDWQEAGDRRAEQEAWRHGSRTGTKTRIWPELANRHLTERVPALWCTAKKPRFWVTEFLGHWGQESWQPHLLLWPSLHPVKMVGRGWLLDIRVTSQLFQGKLMGFRERRPGRKRTSHIRTRRLQAHNPEPNWLESRPRCWWLACHKSGCGRASWMLAGPKKKYRAGNEQRSILRGGQQILKEPQDYVCLWWWTIEASISCILNQFLIQRIKTKVMKLHRTNVTLVLRYSIEWI